MARRTLIIGCGYVGLPLLRRFAAGGHEVTGWVRSEVTAEEVRAQGVERVVFGSVGNEARWAAIEDKFDCVVHCAATRGGGAAAYREVYLEGARLMNRHQPQAARIFVSSTSVYWQDSGEWVDELAPTKPLLETSQVLVQAEGLVLASGGIAVRSAGIYGPERSALFSKFKRGEAIVEGDGSRWVNQIHRDDLVAALVHLLDAGSSGEIYNAADGEPVMLRDFYAWCSEKLGKPMPPPGPVDPKRKRGLTNKRVSNSKLRATGWTPAFPTFREGLADQLR